MDDANKESEIVKNIPIQLEKFARHVDQLTALQPISVSRIKSWDVEQKKMESVKVALSHLIPLMEAVILNTAKIIMILAVNPVNVGSS